MLSLLATIPSIFTAISKVSDLFYKGKEVVEKVTGHPSDASSADELKDEIEKLTPEQQSKWAQWMQQKIDLYKVENERLDIEIGSVSPVLQSKITPEAADKIAIMRMTTRPWAVKMMVYYILFPFALIIFDSLQLAVSHWFALGDDKVFKSFNYVFGALSINDINQSALEKVSSLFGQTQNLTLAAQMYMDSIGWVTSVILSYMGLREYGKYKGTSGDHYMPQGKSTSGITSALQVGKGLVGKIKTVFNRK